MTIHKLDAVLPLRRCDHARFTILDRSLRRNLRDLNRCWVVTTDAEHGELARLIPDDIYRVIPESAVIPEIGFYRRLYRLLRTTAFVTWCMNGRFDTTGWFVQQLVKLAIAARIETDFYLTLDADVICLKPVGHDDLIRDGRAVTNTSEIDRHPDWYAHAERILGVRRSGLTHGVTPALFNREAMLRLHALLGTRISRGARALGALFPRSSRPVNLIRSWRSHLLRNTPWTEYSLYHTFLESAGLFDRYHIRREDDAIYDNANSIWNVQDFRDDAFEAFMNGPAYFLVVQSNTEIPADTVREKIAAYLK